MYEIINKLLKLGLDYRTEIDWVNISQHQILSEKFIKEFRDFVNWKNISQYQTLSENFIREFEDCVDWRNISYYQILSEDFTREFKDRVDWYSISLCQILSESFIREFEDRVNWVYISCSQLLSWDFILEFKDKVNWNYISHCQPFIDPDYGEINKKILKINKLYHFYQETKKRGWFVGYVNDNDNTFANDLDVDLIYNVKSKIYWKDLIKTNKSLHYEPIRQIKYV